MAADNTQITLSWDFPKYIP